VAVDPRKFSPMILLGDDGGGLEKIPHVLLGEIEDSF